MIGENYICTIIINYIVMAVTVEQHKRTCGNLALTALRKRNLVVKNTGETLLYSNSMTTLKSLH